MDGERRLECGTEVERIVFFSNAVFAIPITLLVLDIQVPQGLSPSELKVALAEMWPKYLSYVISFTVIGGYWRAPHRIFHYVKVHDRRLISLNLIFLMCVAFLPFPVSLFGEYKGQRIAVEIYAGSVAASGFFLGGMWWYATRGRRLTDGDLDPGLVRHVMTERLSPPAIALIIVSITFFFGVAAAGYSLVPLLLVQFAVERNLPRLRARRRAKEGSRRTYTERAKKR